MLTHMAFFFFYFFCRAFITNRKIELQLQQYRTIPSYTRPFLSALWGKQRRAIHHPSADRMEVVCVHQRDLLRTCATRNVDVVMSFAPGANAPVNTSLRAEMLPWVEPILPKMTNEVVMRTSGWWERGAAECYVEIQDRVNWNNIPLRTNELSDHIVLDRETNVLTFTYTDVDTCIGRFLTDWERVFMMANLSRQVSSVWFRKYADQLKFEPCDMQTLSFTYAKQLHCSIRWEAPAKGKARRYFVQLTCDAVPGLKRNPHHRVQHFLQDVLNDQKDLVFFVQVLFQTLPLMTTLEHMEAAFARSDTITRLTIIPRAPDAVRILFSTSHGVDIRFDGPDTICISDAAFHHTLYPSVAKATGQPPAPFIPAATAGHAPAASASNAPIQLTQPVQCVEFAVFAQLLVNVDDWIFHPHAENDNDLMITDDDDENDESPWFMQGKAWHTATLEPFVLPFDHGLLCSASLCRNVLLKLQKSAASASPAIDAAAIAL
ncbi:hypothetical protein BC940DRAFT_91016 [Gongronella butleri]|nr:hypothetical protein BC940DRAFT_91016 [Gongronella butleri]